MKKLVSVEWLRGIAALGVCIMHHFNATSFFSEKDLFFTTYVSPITMIGRCGVPVFFVISGFIIPFSMWANDYSFPQQWRNFILRRFVRIEPPYLFSIFVSLFIWYVMDHFIYQRGMSVDWVNVAMHVGYLNVFTNKDWLSGVYWTLGVEFQYYLLISIVFNAIFRTSLLFRLVAIAILVALSFYLNTVLSDRYIFKYIPLFMAGMLSFKYYTKLISLPIFITGMCISIGLIWREFGVLYSISTIFTASIILLNVDVKLKPFYFLGTISYSLYLMHWPFGVDICMNLFKHYLPNTTEYVRIAITLISILFSIMMSYFYYLLIEKSSIKWAKKLK